MLKLLELFERFIEMLERRITLREREFEYHSRVPSSYARPSTKKAESIPDEDQGVEPTSDESQGISTQDENTETISEIERFRKRATELGVKYTIKTSTNVLRKKIDQVLAEQVSSPIPESDEPIQETFTEEEVRGYLMAFAAKNGGIAEGRDLTIAFMKKHTECGSITEMKASKDPNDLFGRIVTACIAEGVEPVVKTEEDPLA